ncbi:MAG: glycosyl hydrolase family [Prolixibacteraceae bacterium]|nr:MAG: glycosyl hydrolase family [Prolixibacteraceae bacterium]
MRQISNFQRRDFIKTAATGIIAATGAGAIISATTVENNTAQSDNIVQKVKTALLSMQRASWEQGVSMQAMWESGDFEMAYLMAKEAVLRQTSDGRLSVVYTDNGVTDPAASGEVVFRMAEKTGEAEFTEAYKKMLDYLLNKAPKSADGILYHVLNSPEFWIDALYMAPPFLCVAGYPVEAVKQIEGYRKVLWNTEKQLFSHRFHDEKKMFPNEKFWGVGNGWAMASYARIIDTLPGNMQTERTRLIKYATENIKGCLPFLRSDGLFHDIIDDSTSFVETNFAQMVAYTIYRGIKSGWLIKTYLEKAEKMREAAHAKVDEHGYVQGVCGAPMFNSPGRATEGQAFYILMEAARNNLM